jgi:hypothetical protein
VCKKLYLLHMSNGVVCHDMKFCPRHAGIPFIESWAVVVDLTQLATTEKGAGGGETLKKNPAGDKA